MKWEEIKFASSISHKNISHVSAESTVVDRQSFGSLHGYFTGMIAQGDCGELEMKMLGGIPALGTTKGDINAADQIGLKICGR